MSSFIRYIQPHKDGMLYIQFEHKRLYQVPHEVNSENRLVLKRKGYSIDGTFVKETKSGIILSDWRITKCEK